MDHQLQSVLRYLQDNKLKLVTAESCTAGMIASTLADEPGSGSWLECAFVTYSESAKIRCIDVKPETIERYNLTSEEVAREMAEGARAQTGADFAISVTGIAGPTGGTEEKPVGTVFIALARPTGETIVKKYRNNYDRETFKFTTSQQALDLLRRELLAVRPGDHLTRSRFGRRRWQQVVEQ